jgi:raffinose/stachyose/melibiose transport system substrate-binding protein
VCLGVLAGQARPARSDQITIGLLANVTQQPGYSALIATFEHAYPDITVQASYYPASVLFQLEPTELGADNAPDLLTTLPGCGTPISVCALAEAGDLAPLIGEPWVRWSLPAVTSLAKHDGALVAFVPTVEPFGMFVNGALFASLGLRVPRTFAQLLSVCASARRDGTVAVLLPAGNTAVMGLFIGDLAEPTVYEQDRHWTSELKAGTASFEASGWHTALHELVEMNKDGCFQPGDTAQTNVTAQFAAGEGLLYPGVSSDKGLIDGDAPRFSPSLQPFPAAGSADSNAGSLATDFSLAVNAHVDAADQAAARTFIDFTAGPKQNASVAQRDGGLTQYELRKQQIPAFMSAIAPLLQQGRYFDYPLSTWWNASVGNVLEQDAVGLLTGQETVDGVLRAMDAAWRQGPS